MPPPFGDPEQDLLLFEQLLKNNSAKKPSPLYSVHKLDSNIQPQDVLNNVCSQILSINHADSKTLRQKRIPVQKSTFLSVNRLPVSKISNQKEFETQCFSNTQLISIIDDAESLHKNINNKFENTSIQTANENIDTIKTTTNIIDTQEFNNTFTQTNVDATIPLTGSVIDNIKNESKETSHIKLDDKTTSQVIEREVCGNINDDDLVFTQMNVRSNKKHQDATPTVIDAGIEDTENGKIKFTDSVSDPKSRSSSPDFNEIIQNLEVKINKDLNSTMTSPSKSYSQSIDVRESMYVPESRSPSPVFVIKPKILKESPVNLVVPLDDFEKFENIAASLVDINKDFDTVKHLVNSQILERELYLGMNNYNEVLYDKEDENMDFICCSPILENSPDDIFGDVKNIKYRDLRTNTSNLESIQGSRDKRSNSLKDEILFSSDEESYFVHREFNDIPLTAALETSFYDQSDILDKNMFVGFQTASNKSIQIYTESFHKAKNILESDKAEDFSLNNLVEYYDEKICTNKDPMTKENELKLTENISSSQDKEESGKRESVESIKTLNFGNPVQIVPEIPTFVGFSTANNKEIKIANKALILGEKLFKDIKFDKNDLLEQSNNIGAKKDSNKINKDVDQADHFNEKIDDIIIEEFENIEMSLEDIESKDNAIEDTHKTNTDNDTEPKNIFRVESKSDFNVIGNIANFVDKYNTNQSSSTASFGGFKTANNRDIKISDAAIKSSKSIFEHIDDTELPAKFKKETNSQYLGKNISNKSSKKLTLSKSMEIRKCKDNLSISPKSNSMVLPIKSSARMKKLFGNLALKDNNEPFSDECQYETNSLKGFQTASKKPVCVSEIALQKSKKIFDEIDSNNKANPIKENANKRAVCKENLDSLDTGEMKTEYFERFTASNKKVETIKESLVKTKRFLDFDDVKLPTTVETRFKGFQTTNDKKVEISNDKSKYVLNDIDVEKCQNQSIFVGFQTANNTKVEISKEALEKSKNIFNDLDIFDTKDSTTTSLGFQTANNKKVEISKEALTKSKNILNDFDVFDKKGSTATSFMGFQTANNKKVEISKEAIKKSKNIFNDLDISDEKVSTTTSFMGFQTANKKKVEVSKEAMQKSKDLFTDLNFVDEKTTSKSSLGFHTANNKKVDISEEALKRSRALFDNIDISKDKEIGNKANESQQLLTKCNILPQDVNTLLNIPIGRNSNGIYKPIIRNNSKSTVNLIDTQVLHNFESSMHTEDFNETPKRVKRSDSPILSFNETPKRDKRSGSPILSCTRAKKRKKFEAPYKEDKVTKQAKITTTGINTTKSKVNFTSSYKKNKLISLKDLSNMTDKHKTIDPYITQFNIENILNFVFDSSRNDITDTKLTITELKELFLSAVCKTLVPNGWLDNHLKLILWKLLSYESKFNYTCKVQSVLDQLKYRYEKELYNTERSAFRKILERDDVSTKTMVLCVAGIYKDGVLVNSATPTDNIELLLTDGWYLIKASVDRMLCGVVGAGRVPVGCKIAVSGAELSHCEGVAPWEDTSAVRLKLSGNSTRPAPWHARLGYTRAAILSHLSTVKVTGGKVARLRAFVTRVYPLLYVEKFEDGSTVTRSERLEHLQQMKHEAERELMMERIYEELQKEFDQESQDSELQDSDSKGLESGSQLARMMKRSKDPMEFRAQLTPSQLRLLQEHSLVSRQRISDALAQRISERISARQVLPLAKGRLAVDGARGLLSIWKPNDAVLELFKEGAYIEIMNAVPTAVRDGEIQLSAGRQTMFRTSKCKELPSAINALQRRFYSISDVAGNPLTNTEYNEIDTAGIVFLIEPSYAEFKSNSFQNVYLADRDKNIISINFWGGVRKFGFENILDTGQVVFCANLQKRAGNSRRNIPQFRVTEYTSFTKTPRNVQAREYVDHLNKLGFDKRKFCDDCIEVKNNYTAIRCLNNENESPYRINRSDYSFTRNRKFIETPVMKRQEDANMSLSGLDFESTFKQETQLSPKTLARKRKVNAKIERLKMYGEPPPLSPINIINRSIDSNKSYKSPLISENASTSAATVNKLPEESPKCPKSPILCTKRGFGKIPVKLSFERNESVDHFAEDFDASPPLSLD